MTDIDPEIGHVITASGIKLDDQCHRFDCSCRLYRMRTGLELCLAGHHQIKHDIRQ